MRIPSKSVDSAVRHLRRGDPVLREVIRRVGAFNLRLDRNRFRMLACSIVAQQLSMGAARTIRGRLVELVGEEFEPARIAAVPVVELRGAGLSGNKAAFLMDLSRAALEGRIRLNRIGRKDDEGVIAELVQVKGIGRWTAQMFLMFSLGRLDVFPYLDLGIRAAIRNLYGLTDLPDEETAHAIAAPWRPYATVASWYCWRSLELNRDKK